MTYLKNKVNQAPAGADLFIIRGNTNRRLQLAQVSDLRQRAKFPKSFGSNVSNMSYLQNV